MSIVNLFKSASVCRSEPWVCDYFLPTALSVTAFIAGAYFLSRTSSSVSHYEEETVTLRVKKVQVHQHATCIPDTQHSSDDSDEEFSGRDTPRAVRRTETHVIQKPVPASFFTTLFQAVIGLGCFAAGLDCILHVYEKSVSGNFVN